MYYVIMFWRYVFSLLFRTERNKKLPCDYVIHGCRTCENKRFDIKNTSIQFNFNSTDDFCPKVLTIKLKNGPRSIVYSNSHEMTDWFKPKQGGEIRTARKLKGKKKL